MSAEAFPYDVFLSHSAKDKAVVRPLAERLRQDGLEVLFSLGLRISDLGFAKPGPFRSRDPDSRLEMPVWRFKPDST